jgi:hypothetical protein
MKLADSRPWSGAEPTGGVSNYLTDRDAKHSLNHITNYSRVKVAGAYKGIDVIFYGNEGDLEYDFAIAPGADPKQFQVVFEGADNLRVDPPSGDLVLTLPGGPELRQAKPKVYQQAGNRRVEVAGGLQAARMSTSCLHLGQLRPKRGVGHRSPPHARTLIWR